MPGRQPMRQGSVHTTRTARAAPLVPQFALIAVAEDATVIGARWGVTERETRLAFPCDEFVASPTLEVWRGVTVRAPRRRCGRGWASADRTVFLRLA